MVAHRHRPLVLALLDFIVPLARPRRQLLLVHLNTIVRAELVPRYLVPLDPTHLPLRVSLVLPVPRVSTALGVKPASARLDATVRTGHRTLNSAPQVHSATSLG